MERNLASPSIATLLDMLECLGSSPADFFNEHKNENVVFTPADMFEKEDAETLKGSITWLVPDAQKNDMEPILLELGPGGESYSMRPNEGEEFGYVLSGSIYLYLGSEKIKVKTGCSFCIHPRLEHRLANAGKSTARIIWVSTPPSF